MKIKKTIELPEDVLLSLRTGEDEFIDEMKKTMAINIMQIKSYQWFNFSNVDEDNVEVENNLDLDSDSVKESIRELEKSGALITVNNILGRK